MQQNEKLFEEIYQAFLRTYRNQATRKDTANYLSSVYAMYKPNTYMRYLDSFLHMMDGTQFASVVPINLSVYLLQRIGQDFGKPALQQALLAEKQHIQYYYNTCGSASTGLRTALQSLASQHDLQIDFLHRVKFKFHYKIIKENWLCLKKCIPFLLSLL